MTFMLFEVSHPMAEVEGQRGTWRCRCFTEHHRDSKIALGGAVKAGWEDCNQNGAGFRREIRPAQSSSLELMPADKGLGCLPLKSRSAESEASFHLLSPTAGSCLRRRPYFDNVFL